jgi:NitT/TauT family transport system ATP-binding protein
MSIRIKNVSKSFGSNLVIKDFSLDIEEGQTLVLMGPSGCGKTTLAHLILGMLKPDKGSIEGISGKSIAAVFQEDRLLEHLTAIKNIQILFKKETAEAEILKHFTELGLDIDSARKPASKLSGGQKRRVAILRAMIANKDFICLDEPFKGMDKDTKLNTMKYVKKHITNKSALLITHDEQEAQFFGEDRIIYLG